MSVVTYHFLADLVLLVHVTFVLFVVFGLLLTIAGGLLGWGWVRRRSFRGLHLVAIGIVVLQAWFGMVCPLTTLENFLRFHSDQASYPGSFISYWLRAGLYYQAPPWVFTLVYTVFGSLVLATWLWIRPVRSRGNSA